MTLAVNQIRESVAAEHWKILAPPLLGKMVHCELVMTPYEETRLGMQALWYTEELERMAVVEAPMAASKEKEWNPW